MSNELERVLRKWSWPSQGTNQTCLEGKGTPTRTSVRKAAGRDSKQEYPKYKSTVLPLGNI
jgi:hypothetical protein